MLCVTFSDCSHLQKLPLSLPQYDNINELCVVRKCSQMIQYVKICRGNIH